jgi:diacylglycerol O-acyltransferase
MMKKTSAPIPTRLSGEDLSFWWADSPMQPTTMAMLMLLDCSPDEARLRLAFERAVAAVPRLAERVVDAPLDLTLPRWERDPTFDVDYHVRRHGVAGTADLEELFRELGPAYETPFDRSRPLWEARVYDHAGSRGEAALFFKLHHAVADGVGGNAIFGAMTDWGRDGEAPDPAVPHVAKGAWPDQPSLGAQVIGALRDRVQLDLERASAVASTVVDTLRHPENLQKAAEVLRSIIETVQFDSHTPLKRFGRGRRLNGLAVPFDDVRRIKKALGGAMIDVILTIMARAIGKWHAVHRLNGVKELMTLVPVNLRKPEEWSEKAHVGNVATGILVPLPIRIADPLKTYDEIHKRMEAKKADPASAVSPVLADMLSVLPRQFVTWMAESTFGNVDFIVTNVPGIMATRYLAGAEIVAAYPFAPVAKRSPVSVALYGYRDQLFIGLDSDETSMPDADQFKDMIQQSFAELLAAVEGKRPARARRARPAKPRRRTAG